MVTCSWLSGGPSSRRRSGTPNAQNDTEAIFIGEPTGGRPNHFGEVKSFNLPNSGLSVRYSTKYFRFWMTTQSLYPTFWLSRHSRTLYPTRTRF